MTYNSVAERHMGADQDSTQVNFEVGHGVLIYIEKNPSSKG